MPIKWVLRVLLCVVVVAGSLGLGGQRADAVPCHYPIASGYQLCVGQGTAPGGAHETELTLRDGTDQFAAIAGVVVYCQPWGASSYYLVWIHTPFGPMNFPVNDSGLPCPLADLGI